MAKAIITTYWMMEAIADPCTRIAGNPKNPKMNKPIITPMNTAIIRKIKANKILDFLIVKSHHLSNFFSPLPDFNLRRVFHRQAAFPCAKGGIVGHCIRPSLSAAAGHNDVRADCPQLIQNRGLQSLA